MENLGYVRMYRSLMKKGYYQNSEHVHLWLHLIFKATYAPKEFLFNEKIEKLQPGQFITSRRKLSNETGIHESKVERILNVFKIEQQIEQQSRNKFRVISILNWDEYQKNEQVNELQMNSQRTASEQQANTNNNIKNIKNTSNRYIPEKRISEQKTGKEETKTFSLPDWVPKESWDAFVEMRKKSGTITEFAKKLLLVKLKKMVDAGVGTAEEILNQSIENSWKGFFELKKERGMGDKNFQQQQGRGNATPNKYAGIRTESI